MKTAQNFLFRNLKLLAWALLMAPLSSPADVSVATFVYGPDEAHNLDLYLPADNDPVPVVLLAHGGLWQGGNRRSLETLCRNLVDLSGERLACASADYRLSQDLGGECTGTGIPAYRDQAADLARAVQFLQQNAPTLGIDPWQVFIGGHSAGAHLAQVLNLRWMELAPPCTRHGGCPTVAGAIGIEGIYDIPSWNLYDRQFWDGRYACATRKAFGAPGPQPPACTEPATGARCWDAGSPKFIVEQSAALGLAPDGAVLLVQSPGDDWVDGSDTDRFGEALVNAFPGLDVTVESSGACGASGHNEVLSEPALARCVVDFIDARLERLAGEFEITPGLNDAWYDSTTAGQGFLISVFPNIRQVFASWFTFDTERPAGEATARLGEPGHRWLTAQGPYRGNTAELTLYVTEGGRFDSATPPASTDPAGAGTLILEFADCRNGTLRYDLPSLGLSGEIPVRRIAEDNVPLCERLGRP